MSNVYEQANTCWPAVIPPCSRVEAARAASRLVKRFKGPGSARIVRRVWVTTQPPYGSLNRGWRRLVHDISHLTFARLHPSTRPHSGFHAHLEREMAEYVVARGWLTGSLKPKPKVRPTPADRQATKLAQAQAAVTRWARREKLAKTKLKKWRRRVAVLGARPAAPLAVAS